MALRSGDLNRQVHIEREQIVGDGQGGLQDVSWRRLRENVWVKGNPIAGKEGVVNGTLRSSQPWRIEMRPTDVTVKDRLILKKGGAVLGIQSVADVDGRNESIVLFCTSEQA